MTHVQRLLAVGTLLLSPSISMADPEVQVNGETISLTPTKITLEGDNVNVTFSDGTLSTFDMEEVVVSFSTTTGVTALQNNLFTINSQVEDQLTIAGIEAGKRFSIVSFSGVTVYSGVTDTLKTNVNLSGMPSGCYLLQVDGKFIKFIKK